MAIQDTSPLAGKLQRIADHERGRAKEPAPGGQIRRADPRVGRLL